MQRSFQTLAALALVAACSKPAPQQQQAAAPPTAPAGVQWTVVVLYNQPKDTAAFEKYYAEKHVPLFVSHAQEIGVTRAELVKFSPGPDGKPAAIYREADLRWDSKEARDKGMATAGFKAAAGDIPVFATGGFTVLLGTKTN
ncbi:MAG TPA: EthD family reductase [Gemmatimonadales bacterium]|nr:EthD family reductase [Gemmatimonadales bacterium]